MRTVRARLVVALATAMLFSAAGAQGDSVPTVDVEDAVAHWVNTVNDGDAAGFAALHTSDVLARHTDGVVEFGTSAMARWARELHEAGLHVVLDDVIGEALTADWVYARAGFTTLDTAGELESSGVWYAVLRRTDDGWRFYRTHELVGRAAAH